MSTSPVAIPPPTRPIPAPPRPRPISTSSSTTDIPTVEGHRRASCAPVHGIDHGKFDVPPLGGLSPAADLMLRRANRGGYPGGMIGCAEERQAETPRGIREVDTVANRRGVSEHRDGANAGGVIGADIGEGDPIGLGEGQANTTGSSRVIVDGMSDTCPRGVPATAIQELAGEICYYATTVTPTGNSWTVTCPQYMYGVSLFILMP